MVTYASLPPSLAGLPLGTADPLEPDAEDELPEEAPLELAELDPEELDLPEPDPELAEEELPLPEEDEFADPEYVGQSYSSYVVSVPATPAGVHAVCTPWVGWALNHLSLFMKNSVECVA